MPAGDLDTEGTATVEYRASTTLPPAATTPAAARAFARDAVAKGRATVHVDDLALVVSELVTNAVLHGTGDVTLELTVDENAVRVEVHDESPGEVGAMERPPQAESGRGLLLVSRLATRWGTRSAGGGKVVWADLVAS
jgi:anti-sigma regulatory factor (Ser/Thr protein kinase)